MVDSSSISDAPIPMQSSPMVLLGVSGVGVVGVIGHAPGSIDSLLVRLSFARLFWNHTWMTRMSSAVSCESCSRVCLVGFEDRLYAAFRTSNCFEVMVVLGLFWLPSVINKGECD